ncbi:endonuclease/exonuclease/phosphatase family protein [Candidatus Tisiphia endosymbiont of Hybos culiciformis]|uniref:endonuclease/exonuclease/phosphatase family protein n=1 Tax=Candidatus Tisiphia endosymbiont of Hybos culiciformis TaxID=3139331 RepID=UPI003CCB0357
MRKGISVLIFSSLFMCYPLFTIGDNTGSGLYSTKSQSIIVQNKSEQTKNLKLISFNIWGGHIRQPLLEFIKLHTDIDIFCFQEVYNNALHKISTDDKDVSLNIFSEISVLLPKHSAFFTPIVGNGYGIGMFIKKKFNILAKGDINIHDNPNYIGRGPTHSRKMQWLNFRIDDQDYTIFNVHGLWNGMGKTDTQERISQSQRIKDFVSTINTHKILCGDFNLTLDTTSVKILENGMRNLIRIYNIKSTRTSMYTKKESFADYIFTSPKIIVNTFKVLKDEVSDHSPLLLEINIPKTATIK